MLPINKELNIVGDSDSVGSKIAYSIKLSDELLLLLNNPTTRGRLNLSITENEMSFRLDNVMFPITRTAEMQSVDVMRLASSRGPLQLIGPVKEKWSVRQELVPKKQEEIRQQTILAENCRLLRRTVPIDEVKSGLKRVVKRGHTAITPMSGAKSIKRLALPPVNSSSTGKKMSSVPQGTMILPSEEHRTVDHTQHCSDKDSQSQNSWSPVTEPCLPAINSRPKQLTDSSSKERKMVSLDGGELIRSRTNSNKEPSHIELEEEFNRRYQDYLETSRWIDDRLSVFKNLKEEILTGNGELTGAQVFRLTLEQQRLAADKEYESKINSLEECHGALMIIKARLAAMKSR